MYGPWPTAGLPPPLQRYNGNTDEVHEYDSTLFEPAHNEQPDSDEEEGGFLFNINLI